MIPDTPLLPLPEESGLCTFSCQACGNEAHLPYAGEFQPRLLGSRWGAGNRAPPFCAPLPFQAQHRSLAYRPHKEEWAWSDFPRPCHVAGKSQGRCMMNNQVHPPQPHADIFASRGQATAFDGSRASRPPRQKTCSTPHMPPGT